MTALDGGIVIGAMCTLGLLIVAGDAWLERQAGKRMLYTPQPLDAVRPAKPEPDVMAQLRARRADHRMELGELIRTGNPMAGRRPRSDRK